MTEARGKSLGTYHSSNAVPVTLQPSVPLWQATHVYYELIASHDLHYTRHAQTSDRNCAQACSHSKPMHLTS